MKLWGVTAFQVSPVSVSLFVNGQLSCVMGANYRGDICFEILTPCTEFRVVSLFSYSARSQRCVSSCLRGRIQVWASLSKGQLCGFAVFQHAGSAGSSWARSAVLSTARFFQAATVAATHGSVNGAKGRAVCPRLRKTRPPGCFAFRKSQLGSEVCASWMDERLSGVPLGCYFLLSV